MCYLNLQSKKCVEQVKTTISHLQTRISNLLREHKQWKLDHAASWNTPPMHALETKNPSPTKTPQIDTPNVVNLSDIPFSTTEVALPSKGTILLSNTTAA